MGKQVFANGMEIVHKAGSGKVIAAFPDVCLSPPAPPAGPVPLPYPDTSLARDLQQGSKSVKIGGKTAGIKDSYYKSSPLGDEAATRNFGGSVLTHGISGKTYFKAYSMNVSIEGQSVPRHLDITTSNHSSEPGSTPPLPNAESMSTAAEEKPKCPCCGGDAHSNQVDGDGKLLPTKPEDAYYSDNVRYFTDRRDEVRAILSKKKPPKWLSEPGDDNNPLFDKLPKGDLIQAKGDYYERKLAELRDLRAGHKNCPNVHEPPDTGCGTHFEPRGNTGPAREDFEKRRFAYLQAYKRAHPGSGVTGGSPVAHKTPLDAGGCPVSENNLVPNQALTGPCEKIDALQTELQAISRSK